MSEKKDRERVIAEVTLSHLMRLGNEQGRPVSREQALAFLNQEGRAFEMWKHMMQAAEEFIAGSLFQHSFSPGGHNGFSSRPGPGRSNQHRRALATFRGQLLRYSKKCAGKVGSALLWLVKWNSRTGCLNGAGDSRP